MQIYFKIFFYFNVMPIFVYMKTKNTRIKPEHAKLLGLTISKGGGYRITEEQYRELQQIRQESKFERHCAQNGIDPKDVSLYWDKSKEFSILVRPELSKDQITPEYIQEVISKINFDKIPKSKPVESDEILRVILTDIHVGMETDSKGYGLYSDVWNEEILFSRLDTVIDECIRVKRNFKEIHVIDLGDFADGWNSLTTRGGHSLPQNMSNRKVFDVGVRFKTELYSKLYSIFKTKIVAYNVCNDNHSSDFGFIINESVRMICELKNENIKVNNLQRFLDHYFYGDHCFILTHGKDESYMKFGFKPKLDAVIKDKIMSYIKHYDIKSKFITVEKGDSHQQLMDSTSSLDFEYNNYRAFSPASSWVNHNFGRSTSGFTLMTVRADKKSKGIESIEF